MSRVKPGTTYNYEGWMIVNICTHRWNATKKGHNPINANSLTATKDKIDVREGRDPKKRPR